MRTPSGTAWHPIAKLVDGDAADALLAFDHGRILADGVERAQAKLEYTTLAASFCPPEFTVTQLRRVYEAVWRRTLDPRNFQRKVTSTPGFLEPTATRVTGVRGRPAQLYRRGPAVALHPPMLRGRQLAEKRGWSSTSGRTRVEARVVAHQAHPARGSGAARGSPRGAPTPAPTTARAGR